MDNDVLAIHVSRQSGPRFRIPRSNPRAIVDCSLRRAPRQDGHLVTAIEETPHERKADDSAATRNDHPHRRTSWIVSVCLP